MSGRSKEAIRTELIHSAKNCLQGYLDDEQTVIIKGIMDLTSSKTADEFITASLSLLDICNITDKDSFISSALENFDDMRPSDDIPSKDYGVKLCNKLRKRLRSEALYHASQKTTE